MVFSKSHILTVVSVVIYKTELKFAGISSPKSTSKFESINEQTISETHLEIVEKGNGEGYLWPTIIELGDVFCDKHA